jgi:rhodanese-related sulfurtransferase
LHNIAGFGAACRQVDELLRQAKRIELLKRRLIEDIQRCKPDCRLNSPLEECLPNTANITFPGVNSALFMAALDYFGIAVSAGSACNTQADEPSHVLQAVGLSAQEARETLRLSLSAETTARDVLYATQVIKGYLSDQRIPVNVIAPTQLNENLLFDEQVYILDIRFRHERKVLKGLPNSHEASFIALRKYLHHLPREKNILVVCQAGYNSPIAAYYLKSQRFKRVGFLLTGILGWKLVHGDLYKKFAGQNISVLTPE